MCAKSMQTALDRDERMNSQWTTPALFFKLWLRVQAAVHNSQERKLNDTSYSSYNSLISTRSEYERNLSSLVVGRRIT